jgi:hypothetical protein
MNKEECFVSAIRNAKGTNPKYYSVLLLREKYNTDRLIEVAQKYGNATVQRLGYIAEASLQAAKMRNFPANNLQKIVNALYQPQRFEDWHYLQEDLPKWACEFLAEQPRTKLNRKWRIISTTPVKDIANWVDLYLIRDYAAASQR